MDITRRGFLKAIGIGAATIALPDFKILLPFEEKSIVQPGLFNVRKMVAGTLDTYTIYVRYDIAYMYKGKLAQCHAASEMMLSTIMKPEEYKTRHHEPMEEALLNLLWSRNIKPKDIVPLEFPKGYIEPPWFTKLLDGKNILAEMIQKYNSKNRRYLERFHKTWGEYPGA